MTSENLIRLHYLCDTMPALMSEISEDDFSSRPLPDKWSKKEILGHLIDSASNNHHRLVRTQFESNPIISYNQDQWNKFSRYSLLNSRDLIAFWTSYNRHLCGLIANMPEEALLKTCNTGNETSHTLAFIFDDYVSHLEHHLQQIIGTLPRKENENK